MVQRPGGDRLLLAPDRQIGDFVAATYRFDSVVVVPVRTAAAGPHVSVEAGPLSLRLTIGPRTPLGWLLRLLPRALLTQPIWASAVDPIARRLQPGVRTAGSAGGGRREWYGAYDVHAILAVDGSLDGHPLGRLTAVEPPVSFGFGSAPRRPCLAHLRTTVRVAEAYGGSPPADDAGSAG